MYMSCKASVIRVGVDGQDFETAFSTTRRLAISNLGGKKQLRLLAMKIGKGTNVIYAAIQKCILPNWGLTGNN